VSASIGRRDLVLLTLAAASWGVGTVVSKRAVEEIPPFTLLPIQLAASLAVLLVLMLVSGMPLRGSPPILSRLGILNPGIAYALGLAGLTWISASLSVLLDSEGFDVGDLLPDESGVPLRIKSLDAFPSPPHTPRAVDGNLKTRWSGGVQRAAADFTIELEQPEHVGQLVISLGEFATDFAIRLRLEVSPDGSQWETVYLGDSALHAYYAAIRHPKEIPLVYPIGRDNVRFIRMRQLGWGTHDWSIAEVRVLN